MFNFDGKLIVEKAQTILMERLNKTIDSCSVIELHNAIATAVVNELNVGYWRDTKLSQEKGKVAHYLSAEFLVGRAIFNNLVCLGIYDQIKTILIQKGFSIEKFEEIGDAALGNGGLGRLAACFLDSAATLKLPLNGYGIRYKFGLFKQKIENGFQTEYVDDWTQFGDPWSIRKNDESVTVEFKNQTVVAVPYDMPVVGYKNGYVCTLRLWEAHPVERFNFKAFNEGNFQEAFRLQNEAEAISSVIYPNDETMQGKILRLKQQYFFCSASLQHIIKKHAQKFNNSFDNFSKLNIFQINDTHPTIAIVECVRLLCEVGRLNFTDAFQIARESFAYTNHTIMAEALEKWPINLIKNTIPNMVDYLNLIQEEFTKEMKKLKISNEVFSNISPIQNDVVNMANLAVYGSKFTNGVAQIHTQILKEDVLKNWFLIHPEKFQNKTNGITQRRWLLLCNERLSNYITSLLNSNEWITNLNLLKQLEQFKDDESVLNELIKIKQFNHEKLAHFLKQTQDIEIDVNTMFDVQIKRLHEYKRQLLNALSILHLYFEIDSGRLTNFEPTTFFFAAKAAPGYWRAKAIIKLINAIANLVNSNSKVNKIIKVVFIANYNVSIAEKLIAAANVSEQISMAGTEASGTSNMKFMLNGAVTLGTYDGANVEIVQEAGCENNYIFGNTVEQIKKLKLVYDPKEIYNENVAIARVLDALDNGLLDDGGSNMFIELKRSLLEGASWHKPDHYCLLADFDSYIEAKLKISADFKKPLEFSRKCLINIANAGKFSSDRTIADYARNIWHIN